MKLSDSLRFIERLGECASSHEVGTAFMRLIEPHGYMWASCGGSTDTPTGRQWHFYFNTWPPEVLIEYQNKDDVRHDILPAVALLTPVPFTLIELLASRHETPTQVEMRHWVQSLGVADTFNVPIHLPGGDFGLCVSVCTRDVPLGEERMAIHLASLHAHQRCRELGGLTEASSVKAPLSPREIECLKWVLQGKSDTDISKILEISHTTVHFHIERVKKKLDVKTRIQAAAMVTSLGYL